MWKKIQYLKVLFGSLKGKRGEKEWDIETPQYLKNNKIGDNARKWRKK